MTFDFTSTSQDDNYRQVLEIWQKKRAEYLHNMLREIDTKSAEDIHAII